MSKKPQADPGDEAFRAGLRIVQGHPLLAPLANEAVFWRGPKGAPPDDGWATVDLHGAVHCHPTRRGTPAEWAHVLAHCLLHLGFGHFERPGRDGPEWNLACCAFVHRFLAALKLGTLPEAMRGDPGADAATEEKLHDRLLDQGVPPGMWHLGCAGKVPDMSHKVFNPRYVPKNGWQWEALLAQGLREAVEQALETAAADRGGYRGRDWLSPNLRRARDWLVASYPLLGGLAASFTYVEDALVCERMGISIAAVSPQAKEIYLNPHARLPEPELRFVLAHELLHVGLRHDQRRQGRDPYLWNVACDYVINGWLAEMQLGVMPADVLHDPALAGESAEGVYDRIAGDLRVLRKLATFAGQGACDMLDGAAGFWDRAEGVDLDAFYRRALTQGLQYQQDRARGYIPAGLIEEIRALDQPPIPWDVALARWFDLHFPPVDKHRSFARPSRRQQAAPDIPLASWSRPSEEVMRARTFGVVLDTSGSMDRAELARGLGAIAAYAAARDVPAARVVFCDAAAYDQGYMAVADIAQNVRVRGRGGTVLQPAIDLLEAAADFPPAGPILIITDGQCDRLALRRDHAYLLPAGATLPFPPRGPVFRMS